MPRQLTWMLWRAPLLEIGRRGTHPLVQGADRFVDDTRKGLGGADRNIETFLAWVHLSWTLEQHDVEAHARMLSLKFGERLRHKAYRHGGRDPDADMSFNLAR